LPLLGIAGDADSYLRT